MPKSDKTDSLKRNMLEALEKTLGVVAPAAKKANIARQTHYEWLSLDPEYRKAVEDIENLALDFAESKLHSQIASDNIVATIFFLKTKGKRRGYVEKSELEHSGEISSNTTIKWGDKEIKV